MSTQVNVGRQTVLVAERSFTYDDFTSGTAAPMIYLKPGTRILRGFIDITTAFNSQYSDAIEVGDTEGTTDDVDRYLVSTDVSSTGITEFSSLTPVANGVIDTAEAVTIELTSSGTAATAGAGVLHIEYVEDLRTTEYHTYRG